MIPHRALRLVCVLLLLLSGGAAAAAPDGEGPAVGVLLRPPATGGDVQPGDAALDALLADTAKDPWLLVEHLLARGRPDVALRLAKRADEAALGSLRAYVESDGILAGAATRVERLEAAQAAWQKGERDIVVQHADAVKRSEGRTTVAGVLLEVLRGWCRHHTGAIGEAMDVWNRAGEAALARGWWRMARQVYEDTAGTAYAAGALGMAARAVEGARAVIEVQGDAVALAAAEFNLGAISQLRGDLPRALRHLDESLHLSTSLGRSAEVAATRSVRSYVLAELGEFAAAMEAQRLLREYFHEKPRDAVWIRNELSLGLIRYRLGDSDGAERALTRALAAARKLGDPEIEAQALDSLGHAYLQEGRWDQAMAAFEDALDFVARRGDAHGIANVKLNVANALRATAQAKAREGGQASGKPLKDALAKAKSLIGDVLPVAKETGAASMALNARITLAQILLAEGKREEAMALLARMRDVAVRLRAWRARMAATVLLAQSHAQAEDWAGVLREAHTAAELLGRSHAGLADADLARARALAPDVFDVGIRAAARTKNHTDLAYFFEAGRAAALLRGLGGRAAALRAAIPASVEARLDEATRGRLAAWTAWQRVRDGRRNVVRPLWRAYKAAQEKEQEALEEVQRAQGAAAGSLAPRRFLSIDRLRSRLRETARPGLRQVFAMFNVQPDEATAFLVERKEARVVTWDGAELAKLRAALASLSEATDGELEAVDLDVLRRLLVQRLGIPPGPTRLFLCPDRELAYAPLSAVLPDDWELVWVPSATTYDVLAGRRARLGQGQRMLGLGDPAYGAVTDPDVLARRGGARLVRLKSSGDEIRSITGARDKRLLRSEATERGLAQALRDPKAPRHWLSIHLACHGLVDVERPEFSSLALTPGEGEDGLLTSSEILRLPMRTDLAVLSACRTGRGRFVRSEGLMGLTRAFMYAGAPRVLVSLWDVDDESTALLMKAFYRAWRGGRGTAEALRLAQIELRDHTVEKTIRDHGKQPRVVKERPFADPRHWAAWVLWGLPD